MDNKRSNKRFNKNGFAGKSLSLRIAELIQSYNNLDRVEAKGIYREPSIS